MFDYQALSTEILTDPGSVGYSTHVDAGSDSEVAWLCNTTMSQETGQIVRADFVVWAVSTGMYGKIKDISNDSANPLRHSALAILAVLEGGASSGIDLRKPENMATLEAWESAGELSESDKTALVNLSKYSLARSIKLFGRLITAADVAKALRGL